MVKHGRWYAPLMMEIMLAAAIAVLPLPDPHTAIADPCEVAAELGYDDWLTTCEGAIPLASGLGSQIETVGFQFRLEEGTTVASGATFGYVAEFDQGVNRASVVVGFVCVNAVTNAIENENSDMSELWLLRDHENLATGWVTVNTYGQCGVGQRRDIVVLSVQSTSDTPWRESGATAQAGWEDGVTTSWWNGNSYTWRVLSVTGAYPASGTATVQMTLATTGGSWPTNNDSVVCTTLTGTSNCSYASGDGRFHRGWPGYTDGTKPPAGTTKTFVVNFSGTQTGLSVGRKVQADPEHLRWMRPGVSGRYEPSEGWWTSGTVTGYTNVDDIIWIPGPGDPSVGDVDGLCDGGDITACVDRCMDLLDPDWLPWENAANFIDFVRCLLTPQTSVPEVIGTAVGDLYGTTTWQVLDVSVRTFVDASALPSQYAVPCGVLLTLDVPLGGEVDVSTCGVPSGFTQVVYWASTVLMSLAFAFGILFLVFWALNWQMPFNSPEGEE